MFALAALLALVTTQAPLSVELVPRCLPEEPAKRVLAARYELALAGVRTTVDGEEQPGRPTAGYRTTGAVELRLSERSEVCAGGRPTRLVRRYDGLESERSEELGARDGGEPEVERWSEDSVLEGETVRFERDGAAWRARWADPAREGEPPRGLAAELDLAFLAPGRAVTVGERWEVAPRDARVLLRPWVGVPFHVAGEAPADGGGDAEDPPETGGVLRVRLESVEEGAAGPVARLALEIALAERRDLTDQARADSAAAELPQGARRPVIDAMTDESTYEGAGSALWDVARGRLLELELACDTRQVQTIATRISLGSREGRLERTTTLEGLLALTLRCE
jgi:hypothetical protein